MSPAEKIRLAAMIRKLRQIADKSEDDELAELAFKLGRLLRKIGE